MSNHRRTLAASLFVVGCATVLALAAGVIERSPVGPAAEPSSAPLTAVTDTGAAAASQERAKTGDGRHRAKGPYVRRTARGLHRADPAATGGTLRARLRVLVRPGPAPDRPENAPSAKVGAYSPGVYNRRVEVHDLRGRELGRWTVAREPFEFDVPAADPLVEVRAYGFRPRMVEVPGGAGDTVDLEVVLEPAAAIRVVVAEPPEDWRGRLRVEVWRSDEKGRSDRAVWFRRDIDLPAELTIPVGAETPLMIGLTADDTCGAQGYAYSATFGPFTPRLDEEVDVAVDVGDAPLIEARIEGLTPELLEGLTVRCDLTTETATAVVHLRSGSDGVLRLRALPGRSLGFAVPIGEAWDSVALISPDDFSANWEVGASSSLTLTPEDELIAIEHAERRALSLGLGPTHHTIPRTRHIVREASLVWSPWIAFRTQGEPWMNVERNSLLKRAADVLVIDPRRASVPAELVVRGTDRFGASEAGKWLGLVLEDVETGRRDTVLAENRQDEWRKSELLPGRYDVQTCAGLTIAEDVTLDGGETTRIEAPAAMTRWTATVEGWPTEWGALHGAHLEAAGARWRFAKGEPPSVVFWSTPEPLEEGPLWIRPSQMGGRVPCVVSARNDASHAIVVRVATEGARVVTIRTRGRAEGDRWFAFFDQAGTDSSAVSPDGVVRRLAPAGESVRGGIVGGSPVPTALGWFEVSPGQQEHVFEPSLRTIRIDASLSSIRSLDSVLVVGPSATDPPLDVDATDWPDLRIPSAARALRFTWLDGRTIEMPLRPDVETYAAPVR